MKFLSLRMHKWRRRRCFIHPRVERVPDKILNPRLYDRPACLVSVEDRLGGHNIQQKWKCWGPGNLAFKARLRVQISLEFVGLLMLRPWVRPILLLSITTSIRVTHTLPWREARQCLSGFVSDTWIKRPLSRLSGSPERGSEGFRSLYCFG